MPRIIAGTAGGRRLHAPQEGTRPTSDRVREALFSALHSRVDFDGMRVLDLYAGSGALGLEALSRGAGHLLAIESDHKAAAVIERNVADLGLPGAEVRKAPVAAVLAHPPAVPYDLVFSDPPYSLDGAAIVADLLALQHNHWVERDSLIVVERSTRSPETAWPPGYQALRVRRYGETRIETATVAA